MTTASLTPDGVEDEAAPDDLDEDELEALLASRLADLRRREEDGS